MGSMQVLTKTLTLMSGCDVDITLINMHDMNEVNVKVKAPNKDGQVKVKAILKATTSYVITCFFINSSQLTASFMRTETSGSPLYSS